MSTYLTKGPGIYSQALLLLYNDKQVFIAYI